MKKKKFKININIREIGIVKVFRVLGRDLKNIFTNPVATIIIIGLCILPSLYAWINIKACWDPYANTSDLPIVVVNKDEGEEFNGNYINAGNEVIENLAENTSIGWVVESDWQANDGLNKGKYYALIEIPANFTSGLISLTTTSPEKPSVIYRANEKANAIATKITNVATESLTREIKSNFINTVNKTAFETLNIVGEELEKNKPEILDLRNTLESAMSDLTKTSTYIASANASTKGLQEYLLSVKNDLPKITESINNLQKVVESSKNLINTTNEGINSISSNLNNDMVQIQTINQKIQSAISSLQIAALQDNNSDQVQDLVDSINDFFGSINNYINSDLNLLNTLNSYKPNGAISDAINSFTNLQNKIGTQQTQLSNLIAAVVNRESQFANVDTTSLNNDTNSEAVDGGRSVENENNEVVGNNNQVNGVVEDTNTQVVNNDTSIITGILNDITSLNNEMLNIVINISNGIYTSVIPSLNEINKVLSNSLDTTDGVIESTKAIVPQLNALANFLIATNTMSIEEATNLNSKIESLNAELTSINEKTKDFTEETLDKIIEIMMKDPEQVASFLSSPVDLVEDDIYGEGIFGVGLTPFYSVLAIWVGVLLACCLLAVEYEKHVIKEEKLSHTQEHFGKLLLFLLIAMVQATIIVLGDIYILGVKPSDMALLFEFTIVTAVTFTFIIYTLVSMFGNVGKAIAVIIMVFQIAGSGGIYPIQTNPKIFGVLEPLWPFTYAINGFREAISGPVWEHVQYNFMCLGIFIGGFMLLTILKKPIHKLAWKMDHKFRESGM